MSIKTIMVHLALEETAYANLNTAINMASHLSAHLIVMHVARPIHSLSEVVGRGASSSLLNLLGEHEVEVSKDLYRITKKSCNEAKVSWEWQEGDEEHFDHIIDNAHRVDLILISQQKHYNFEEKLTRSLAEKVILNAGGPVLSLPLNSEFDPDSNDNNCLIAWNCTASSTRAMRDSLAILKKAANVYILQSNRLDPEYFITGYLQRHGVNAKVISIHRHKPHREILVYAKKLDINMIVMGAYDTSILDNFIFGSATRKVISRAEIPVLLSH